MVIAIQPFPGVIRTTCNTELAYKSLIHKVIILNVKCEIENLKVNSVKENVGLSKQDAPPSVERLGRHRVGMSPGSTPNTVAANPLTPEQLSPRHTATGQETPWLACPKNTGVKGEPSHTETAGPCANLSCIV